MKPVITLWLMMLSARVFSATLTADSCSLVDVQATVNLAVAGDTVTVPAGDCTWTNYLFLGSKITLRGAGVGNTIIRQTVATYTVAHGTGSRVTGFTFSIQNASAAGVVISGGKGWRVDNCRFTSSFFTDALLVTWSTDGAQPTGVFDHNVCIATRCNVAGGVILAHKAWTNVVEWGSTNSVYMEDNIFIGASSTVNVIDSNYGARYVFRYNSVVDSTFEAHSVQGAGRASRAWEIYKNTITQSNVAQAKPMSLRGGTGVVFSNTIAGTWSTPTNLNLDNVRSYGDYIGLSSDAADGGAWKDGNTAVTNATSTGTHTGGTGATLENSGANWGVNIFRPGTQVTNFWVWNLTDGSKGQITANDATTVTATLAGGTDNQWESGDSYKVTGGWPARDQIGRGADVSLTLNTYSAGPQWPLQADDPAYCWGNKFGTTNVFFFVVGGHLNGFDIKANRDYFNGVARPDYTPLTYPHPLVSFYDAPVIPAITIGPGTKLGAGMILR